MFFRIYEYGLKRCARQKILMFWNILFPLVLGTLFKVSFGDMNEREYMFQQIPVAYVETEQPQQEFREILAELEEENQLVEVREVSEEEAKKLLQEEEVKGIFWNDSSITLTVTAEGMDTSILKSIQEQYEKTVGVFSEIAAEHPENLQTVADNIAKQWNYLEENSITHRNMDMMLDYFYALIAMNCLYGCFSGVGCAVAFKANLSALGARRNVASTKRFVILLADICAKITAQFFCTAVGAMYLKYALKVNLGDETARILLMILIGSAIGVMTGVFVGSIGKIKESVREGLCVGVTMIECFLAGLMASGMYQLVETYAPVINRINPAALIVKAMYSLNIYETYTRYNQCILGLLAITVVLCIGSYLMVRRERYASI